MTRTEMTDTERLLTETLTHYADDTEVSPDALELIAQRRAGRGWLRRGWLGPAGVAVATTVVAVVAIVLANGPDGPVTRVPDVLGQPGGGGPIDEWQSVPLGGMSEHDCGDELDGSCARLVDAAPLGAGGFVVVGNVGVSPVVHRSADGRDWSGPIRLPVPESPGGGALQASVEAIATDGETLVAVGRGYPRGIDHPLARTSLVWHSSDGISWQAGDLGVWSDGAGLTDVARNGGGFVATGLVQGGRDDRVDLGVFSSEDGRSWAFDGFVGRPLPVVGRLPMAGVEAGAGTVVYAEIAGGGAGDGRACGHEGLAVWVGDKDGVPTLGGNSDDPQRAGLQVASPGLEQAVLRPCGHVELSQRESGGVVSSQLLDTTVAPLRPGITWDQGQPTLHLHARSEPAAPDTDGALVRRPVEQQVFRPEGEGWVGQAFAPEQHLEIVGAGVATDGYRLGVAVVDGTVSSDDGVHRATHLAGDGVGTRLGFLIDEGDGWAHAGPADPLANAQHYEALTTGPCGAGGGGAGAGEGEGWGHGAIGAQALAVNGNHVLIVGRASSCLHRQVGDATTGDPFTPALWIGPLP